MSNKFLKFLKFSQLTYWTAKRYFAKELQLTNKYPKVLMGFFLSKSQPNIINIKDEGQYKIIGVRSYGKGAYINREVAGQQLTMKKYQLAKANQLIWCKVDTKNNTINDTKLIPLSVQENNISGLNFWKKMGFYEIGRCTCDGFDNLSMEYDIS